MKLDTLFEKFLSLFKKEESEIEETETNEVEHEGNESSNLRRSRAGRKEIWGQLVLFEKFWRRYHLTKILMIIGLSASLFVGVYLFALAKSTNVTDLQNALKTRTLIFDREEKRSRCSIRPKRDLCRTFGY